MRPQLATDAALVAFEGTEGFVIATRRMTGEVTGEVTPQPESWPESQPESMELRKGKTTWLASSRLYKFICTYTVVNVYI